MRADSNCMSRFGVAVLVATATTLSFGAVVGSTAVQAAPPVVAVETSTLVYTVTNGDYLFGIAVKLKVTINDLLAVNALTVTSSIHPGDQLAVPNGGSLPAERAAATTGPAPAAAAQTAIASVVSVGSTPYVVIKNDYLVGIASSHGVTLKALLDANSMTVTTPIFPGTKLTIPPATLAVPAAPPKLAAAAVASAAVAVPANAPEAPAVAAVAGEYVVGNGDFFYSIATRNGVTLKALLAANNMTVASMIHPGTRLVLPPATLPIPALAAAVAATPATDGTASPQQSSITRVLSFLQGELGKPYLFNTAGPDTYDCSGLVVAAFRQVGVNLPHQSLLQSAKGVAVDWRTVDIQAGDLVFYVGSGKTYISHVGIAISSTQWIQSARAGDVVKISPLPADDRIAAVRRVIN
ncbi:MAG: LysM peptidoglycan-binding domain-containing protein [Ilumatobacteraceae bacterium]